MTTMLDAIVAAIDHQPGMSTTELRARAERSVARRLPLASAEDRRSAVDAALDRLNGRGPIDRLLADPDVDEVIVHAGGELWVDRAGCLSPAGSISTSDTNRFLERALAPLGRRLDRTTPIVDARLDDGTRLCAAIAPVAVAGTEVSLRRHRVGTLHVHDFAPEPVCEMVATLLERRSNIVVTGATSSGKTSLLACLITDRLRAGERIVLPKTLLKSVLTVTSCASKPARDHPKAPLPFHSTSCSSPHCVCGPTDWWSAKSEVTRSSRSCRR
jgi:pilus assembly protein CpaF